jgi:hypothetical protein
MSLELKNEGEITFLNYLRTFITSRRAEIYAVKYKPEWIHLRSKCQKLEDWDSEVCKNDVVRTTVFSQVKQTLENELIAEFERTEHSMKQALLEFKLAAEADKK